MKKLVIAIVTALSAAAGISAPASAWHDETYDPYYAPSYEDAQVEVLWGSSWWSATILQARGNQFLVHYDGYSSTWDEWVGPDRIRGLGALVAPYADPALVSIYWGSSWYPGRVLRAENGRFLVSYDGYSASWNEWVGRDRLRFTSPLPYRIHKARPVAPSRRVRYEPAPPAWGTARPVHGERRTW